ncbi:MAG: helix-turn-helix domain-containing protein [Acutalibacteraceae bacterium]
MLVFNAAEIGNRLLNIRKKTGLTQAELAEKAGLSDRTYADIERGTVNMRTETLLRICNALNITPNDIFTDINKPAACEQEVLERLNRCTPSQKTAALELLSVYLKYL